MCVSVCEGGVKLDKKAVLVGVKSSPVGYVEIYIGVFFGLNYVPFPQRSVFIICVFTGLGAHAQWIFNDMIVI